MADPIQTLDGTETGAEWYVKVNDNTNKRQWLDFVTVTSASSPYTVSDANEFIRVDATSGAVTLNLPAAAGVANMRLWIEPTNVANTITIDGNGAETIDGSATKVLGTANRLTELFCTGTAWESWSMDQTIAGGGDALTTNPLSQFAATTSAQLAGVISDETGSGALVFATSPALTTPNIGVATATSVNKVAVTAPATSATLTIADGATLTVSASATVSNGTHSGTNTGDQTAASLGLGTSDSPQFAAVNVGHASDTTITRTGAGDVAVEGNALYRAGGTDVPVADGGTGASTAADARTNLGVGAIGQLATLQHQVTVVIDDGGSVLSAGVKRYVPIDVAMTITGWTIVADQSGSVVVDVWKDTYANFPPTVADTIAGSEKPTLSSAQKNQDLTLSSWTTAVAQGDILGFNVDSATTVTWVAITIRGTRVA